MADLEAAKVDSTLAVFVAALLDGAEFAEWWLKINEFLELRGEGEATFAEAEGLVGFSTIDAASRIVSNRQK